MGNCLTQGQLAKKSKRLSSLARGFEDMDFKFREMELEDIILPSGDPGSMTYFAPIEVSAREILPEKAILYYADLPNIQAMTEQRGVGGMRGRIRGIPDTPHGAKYECYSDSVLVNNEEEYWVKNPKKPKRSNEEQIFQLFALSLTEDPDHPLFIYSEGNSGAIAVHRNVLGQGTMSVVKYGRFIRVHKTTDVAIKIIDLDLLPFNFDLNILQRQIILISRVKHPNVIEVYSIFLYRRNLHIVMEIAPNGTLWNYIKDHGRLSENETMKLFCQISEGLRYCHSECIVHRDLNCESILFDEKHQIKITGFGSARYFDRTMPPSLSFYGTLEYTAPEVLVHHRYNPVTADMWSLGICFYVMLVGQCPFSVNQLRLYKLKEARRMFMEVGDAPSQLSVPEPAVPLSHCAKRLLGELLQEDPKRRMTMHQLFKHYWFRK